MNENDLLLTVFKIKSAKIYHRSDPNKVEIVLSGDNKVITLTLTSETEIKVEEQL